MTTESYLAGILADATRPFRYRSGVSWLLGHPDAVGPEPVATRLPTGGLPYLRARAMPRQNARTATPLDDWMPPAAAHTADIARSVSHTPATADPQPSPEHRPPQDGHSAEALERAYDDARAARDFFAVDLDVVDDAAVTAMAIPAAPARSSRLTPAAQQSGVTLDPGDPPPDHPPVGTPAPRSATTRPPFQPVPGMPTDADATMAASNYPGADRKATEHDARPLERPPTGAHTAAFGPHRPDGPPTARPAAGGAATTTTAPGPENRGNTETPRALGRPAGSATTPRSGVQRARGSATGPPTPDLPSPAAPTEPINDSAATPARPARTAVAATDSTTEPFNDSTPTPARPAASSRTAVAATAAGPAPAPLDEAPPPQPTPIPDVVHILPAGDEIPGGATAFWTRRRIRRRHIGLLR
jgi:hypothetical protein